ncbi:MAG: hypothetical protein JXA24_01015 [Proteobacteria bacterium]|nr:hypothetical protein [Pseudomonadota bacterium]
MISCSCVSTYNSKARPAHAALFRGDYAKAAELIEKVEPSPRDRLLYLMDRGMILHAAGRYEDSNRALEEAESLSEAYEPKSVTRETSATLWSEEATRYSGDRHEKVLVPVVRMLNYILLDKWDEALVEVRRIENVSERVYGRPGGPPNAFATYLSAVVWEAMGHIGDAVIDYRRTGKIDKELPYYGADLRRAYESGRRKKGEIVVIVESGRSPVYVSRPVTTGLVSMQLPTVVAWPGGARDAEVFIDGESAGRTHSFHDIGKDILEALAGRQKRSFVRKAIKSALQTGMYVAGIELSKEDEVEAQIAGLALILLGMSMSAAEKADERSWRSLPSDFGVGRFFVAPGMRRVRIVPDGGGAATEVSIEVLSDRPKAVLASLYGSGAGLERIERVEPVRVKDARAAAARLESELASDPGNGGIMIDLAYAKMESGDFDVEGLLRRGMESGGDADRVVQGIRIARTVRGDSSPVKAASSCEEPGSRAQGLKPAFEWYLAGLACEKRKEYGRASAMYATAHRLGLVGPEVEKRVMESFRRADDSFKDSEQGREVMEDFAEGLIQ